MSAGNSTVTYKDVPSFPGYRVGDDGSIWSCRVNLGRGTWGTGTTWKKLKPLSTSKYGHTRVAMHGRKYLVHRIVLLTFIGQCPDGMECCHRDSNARNNALSNLRWDTPGANGADKARHGQLKGERNGRSKLTASLVRAIRREYAKGGVTFTGLGRRYGVSGVAVRLAVKRATWRHI